MNQSEILQYFKELPYKEQQKFFRTLALELKSPPARIAFPLDPKGLEAMTSVMQYCEKHSIEYSPEKKSDTKICFLFPSMAIRNEVLIGRLAV